MIFIFQAEDGIRYLVRSRGLGDVYKRQPLVVVILASPFWGTLMRYDTPREQNRQKKLLLSLSLIHI